jgi:hypothetical protein
MKIVPRHKFNSNYTEKEVEENLGFLRDTLSAWLQRSTARGGVQADAQFTRGCWTSSVGRFKEALEMFQGACDCAGAQSVAISAKPGAPVSFTVRGREVTGQGGPPQFGSSASYWVHQLLLAAALRRADVMVKVLAVPDAVLESSPGDRDACFILLVRAVRSFFQGKDFQGPWEAFERQSRPEALKIASPRVMERFRALGPALAALAAKDEARFNEALVAVLDAHKWAFGKGKEAKGASSLISAHAAGLMRLALDRGMKVEVESDYAPKWLIGLETL